MYQNVGSRYVRQSNATQILRIFETACIDVSEAPLQTQLSKNRSKLF